MNASRPTAALLVAALLPLLPFGRESTLPAAEKSAQDAAEPFGLPIDKGAGKNSPPPRSTPKKKIGRMRCVSCSMCWTASKTA